MQDASCPSLAEKLRHVGLTGGLLTEARERQEDTLRNLISLLPMLWRPQPVSRLQRPGGFSFVSIIVTTFPQLLLQPQVLLQPLFRLRMLPKVLWLLGTQSWFDGLLWVLQRLRRPLLRSMSMFLHWQEVPRVRSWVPEVSKHAERLTC